MRQKKPDFNEQTVIKIPLSNPQKRPLVMSPRPKTYNPRRNSNSYQKFVTCCSSSEAPFATKAIVLKLLKFTHVKLFLIKLPYRVLKILKLLILLFLPSVYYFLFLPSLSFVVCILFVIAFCSAILILSSSNFTNFHSTNFSNLANLTNFPSIRSLVVGNFVNLKAEKGSKTCPPVVWSIGSKNRIGENTDCGFLVKVYSNGDVYEGEFYKGKCSGSGVYHYNLNGRYEGDWVDQKYDGYGVETWSKGSRFRGQYREGLRHGYGVYRFYTGDVYAGEWFKGQCHGCGVHTCEDGSKYTGEFNGGIKHGLGHYHFRNGDIYAGEYFADKMHGFGVYRFANGHRYEGAWHEGRRQGFGMYTFRNGDAQSGHWDNGVLTVSTSQDPTVSGSSSSVSHVKVLNAVQEARRIAERAVSVAKIDERVSRAVAAANRAANAARVAAVKAVQNQMHHHGDEHDDIPLAIV